MTSKQYSEIPSRLDEFEFAQGKKLVALKGGVSAVILRDEMIPFIGLQECVKVGPIKEMKNLDIVVYWDKGNLRAGYISHVETDGVLITSIKLRPRTWKVKTHHILGKVLFRIPSFLIRYKIKKILKGKDYQSLD